MNNLKILEANINDLISIQELNLELFEKEKKEYDSNLDINWTFGEKGTDYFTRRIKDNDGVIFIAKIDSTIIGYISGGLIKSPESYRILAQMGELETMYVKNEYRKLGIGSELYLNFLNWSKEKGVCRIKVEASAENKEAIDFYRKNNFKDYTLILENNIENIN